MKKRVVVVCPGRGSYVRETLGYLKRFRGEWGDFLNILDEKRRSTGVPTLSELDEATVFKPQLHTPGENASVLIYACSYCDFLNLDRSLYEIVAVTGNSMGWYSALAVAGALDVHGAYRVIQTMGSMMADGIVGGQIIYPVVDETWKRDSQIIADVEASLGEVNRIEGAKAFVSIELGGYKVIGGNQKALDFLLNRLPKKENYPFQLINHAAFHTPLLNETSRRAYQMIPMDLFQRPKYPMVDGRGKIWMDYAIDLSELHKYTFGHQVTETYDFTKAIVTSLKEFCPDQLVLLGPGNTLGGSIGQILVNLKWQSISSKADFSRRQKEAPLLLSLGIA